MSYPLFLLHVKEERYTITVIDRLQTNYFMNHDTHIDKAQEKRRKIGVTLVWFLLICASYGTYILSSNIKAGANDTASVFFGLNAKTYEVNLSKDSVSPTMLTIKVGDSLQFISVDKSAHNIALRSSRRGDPRVESGEFGGEDTYELQFHEAGQFELYDRLNLDNTITVVVEP